MPRAPSSLVDSRRKKEKKKKRAVSNARETLSKEKERNKKFLPPSSRK